MRRIKEWWDALTPTERYIVKAYDEPIFAEECRVCGHGPINASMCTYCAARHNKLVNRANEAIQDIAMEFFHERLIYTDFGNSYYVEVEDPTYDYSAWRFKDGELVKPS